LLQPVCTTAVIRTGEHVAKDCAGLGNVGKELSILVGVLWLSGLRLSEATSLKVSDLTLPEEGWGRILVSGASVQVGARWTNSGNRNDDKGLKWRRNGETRDVPIPRERVTLLVGYVKAKDLTSGDLLFPGPTGASLSLSTMDNYWRRTRSSLFADGDPLQQIRMSYLRHTNATVLLDAGVPVTEVARRLGHSPDVCLRIYAGVMSDGQDQANARIDTVLQAGIAAERQSREQ
jgi:integrase